MGWGGWREGIGCRGGGSPIENIGGVGMWWSGAGERMAKGNDSTRTR